MKRSLSLSLGLVVLVGSWLAGCGDATDANPSATLDAAAEAATDAANEAGDAGDEPDATPDDDASTDAASDAATDAETDAANPCGAAGGLCVATASDCTTGGGTVAAAGAPGCVFDDGPGACCVPPAPAAEGTSCASFGGVCAPIAGCNFVGGAFAPEGCTGVNRVCCVPSTICGEETQACCNDMTTFRPACDRGTWKCTIDGTTLKPANLCP